MHPIQEVKKEVDPEGHKGPVPVVQTVGGKGLKEEVEEDQGEQPVGPVVEGQMDLGDDVEMFEVAQILVDMDGIHRRIEAKKRRKVYAAAYRKRKAAEKKAMKEEEVSEKRMKNEVEHSSSNNSEGQAGQTSTFFGVTKVFRVNTTPLHLN